MNLDSLSEDELWIHLHQLLPIHFTQFSCNFYYIYEPKHNKTNKMFCVPGEDSDQPGHPPVWSAALASVQSDQSLLSA